MSFFFFITICLGDFNFQFYFYLSATSCQDVSDVLTNFYLLQIQCVQKTTTNAPNFSLIANAVILPDIWSVILASLVFH